MNVCMLCVHPEHDGHLCGSLDGLGGMCRCTGPSKSGTVTIKIPEDVWEFFSETSHGRGEQAIATTLRAVMGLFS
jgi:hypothetical protein